ncbi:MAG: WG repeat-containing protein, partial [Bacteroidota bacterium]
KLGKYKVDKMTLFYEGVSLVQDGADKYYINLKGARVDYNLKESWMGDPFTFVGEPKVSDMMTDADPFREWTITKENGLWGIKVFDGSWKVKPQYTYMKELPAYGTSYFSVAKDSKQSLLGVIDLRGKQILPFTYAKIEVHSYKEDAYFHVRKDNRWGMVDGQNQVLIPIEYNRVSGYGAFRMVTSNGKMGLYDLKGNMTLPLTYDEIRRFFL